MHVPSLRICIVHHCYAMSATIEIKSARVGTKQLAMFLNVSTRTVQNYRDRGQIPFIRINARTFRYNLAEVEIALRRN